MWRRGRSGKLSNECLLGPQKGGGGVRRGGGGGGGKGGGGGGGGGEMVGLGVGRKILTRPLNTKSGAQPQDDHE